MHLLLVTICYPPEIRSVSTMMQELAEGLVARGHRVTVLTSWPQYNLSADARARVFTADAMEGGVRVIRVKTLPTHRVAYIVRGIAQMLLPRLFIRALRAVREPIEAVIVYTPHLPLAMVGAYVKRRTGARYLLNVQDIFPQNAIDLGILKNRQIIAWFERMELHAYAAADAIATHTPGGREFLITRKGVAPEKVTVVPNWIDVAIWDRAQPTGAVRAREGLVGKFVVLFAGIFGPAQDIPFILDVAARVQDCPDIVFVMVGDGTARARAIARVSELGLHNVRFMPFIDPAEYPRLVKEMDVGLLTLGMGNRTASMPGKLWGYMAAGIPALGFLNRECDAHRIVREAGCGWTCTSDDPDRAAALVRAAHAQRADLPQMGARGHTYVATYYAKDTCIAQIEELLVPLRVVA